MIVDNSPMPEAAKPKLATESAVSSPSTTLTPRRYFLYSEALKSRSFFETGSNYGYTLKEVIVSSLTWRVEAFRNNKV